MSERKKETFDIVEKIVKDGETTTKTTKYAIVEPKPCDGREGQKVYNSAFSAALSSNALLRQKLGTHMREQGLWDEKKEQQQKNLIDKLNKIELTLKKGGIKLTEARELAIDMRRVRLDLRQLIAKRNELDAATAEGQAENARFNALVSLCLVYNESGEPVYKSLDNYLENSDDEAAFEGAQTLASMMFELDKNHDAGLPENKFLSRWKFVDEELRLVNKDGHLVDTEGRLINEEGFYVDAEGGLVDMNGTKVDKDGNYAVESSPFLDDKGNELADPDAPQPMAKAKAKVKAKAKSAKAETPASD